MPLGSMKSAGSASNRFDSLSAGATAVEAEECSSLLEPELLDVDVDVAAGVGEQSGEKSSTVQPVSSMSSARSPNPGNE